MGSLMLKPSLVPGRGPAPIDVEMGKRIRMRRLLLGMTQSTLAGALGICWQQVHKYERGINRVGASRLGAMADALGVPVSYFFDDVPARTPAPSMPGDLMERPETIEWVRLYYAIRDETMRHQARAIMKAIAEVSAKRPERPTRRRGWSPGRQ